jgi:ABC-type multidrug transport system ATPase subunit
MSFNLKNPSQLEENETSLPKNGTGMYVDVVDVSYHVEIKGKKKQLLSNVSLRLYPGEMCALMGPSGAGKR